MKDPKDETSIAGAILFMLLGPLIWAGYFLLVYGAHSTVCAVGTSVHSMFSPPYVALLVGAFTIMTLAVLLLAMWRPGWAAHLLRYDADDHDNQVFSIRIMRLLSFLSLAGVIWAGAAFVALDFCDPLR